VILEVNGVRKEVGAAPDTPLVRFCRDPWLDATKERFGQRPATVAPPDRLAFRLRRKLRGWRGRMA
jgi:hypothetical protein